ncbi:MAG: hypothetical protein ACXADL_13040 [Candidatus Thorarchaeota archaeon]
MQPTLFATPLGDIIVYLIIIVLILLVIILLRGVYQVATGTGPFPDKTKPEDKDPPNG